MTDSNDFGFVVGDLVGVSRQFHAGGSIARARVTAAGPNALSLSFDPSEATASFMEFQDNPLAPLFTCVVPSAEGLAVERLCTLRIEYEGTRLPRSSIVINRSPVGELSVYIRGVFVARINPNGAL